MALDNCELFNADGSVKPLRQMDPNLSTLDANMVERDRRMDFLTKSDGTPVQYFGEINPVFFSSDDLHILSRTVMDSMSRDDPNGRAVVLQTISNVQSWVNGQAVVDFRGSAFTLDALLNHVYPGGVAPALSAEGTQARNVLNAFRTRLQSTLPLVHPAFNATDDKFFLNLLMAGRVPVVNGPPPAAGQPAANAPNTHIGSSAEENVHKAFLKTLVKGVPDSASGEVEKARDVATDATIGTPLERAQLIKDITLSTLPHSERPEWAQHGDYNTWYSEQIAMYKGQLARATALSASKTATPSVNIGWAVAGSDLPDNWHYVFPEHERVMTNVLGIGTDVPNSVSELPTARVVDALVRSARRSTYAGDADGPQYAQVGAGFGVSRNERIGAMNFGQNDADVQPSRVEGLRRDAHTLLRTRAHFGANLETAFGVTGSEVFAGGERHVVDINQWATNFLVKFIAFYFLHVQVKKAAFDAFIRHNVLFPMGFIIARPHATYRTRILIKLQSRGGAGKTYMGHSNAEIGHDVNRKIGLLHFTTYMAAVVDKPQNVFVQPDLYVDRYLGGLGVGFFNEVSYREVRLQGNNASIVVLPIPYAEKVIPNPMDISGRWYTASQYEMIDGATFERAHYSTHYRMNQIYKFYDQVNADEEFDMAWSHDSYVVLNRAMWRGMQWHNTPQSGKFDRVMPNTGHFGPDVYVGVKDVRNGATTYVEPQNWNSKFSVL
jgi:hypothetical protein